MGHTSVLQWNIGVAKWSARNELSRAGEQCAISLAGTGGNGGNPALVSSSAGERSMNYIGLPNCKCIVL